jgi:hypothetical protein
MYYDNNEDDEGLPRITPYNAFDVLVAVQEAAINHEARITMAWDNIADTNKDIMKLKQAYINQQKELNVLKHQLIPLIESLRNQLKQITEENTK